ncbi:unnamed protein product [Choristocarpus tenellus]
MSTALSNCIVSSPVMSYLHRKPTSMYTALVAHHEGEYRFANSRLITNAEGEKNNK